MPKGNINLTIGVVVSGFTLFVPYSNNITDIIQVTFSVSANNEPLAAITFD